MKVPLMNLRNRLPFGKWHGVTINLENGKLTYCINNKEIKMKYITTKKNPIFKKGQIFEFREIINQISVVYGKVKVSHHLKNYWISNGCCKEVYEPKWTDQDMVDFACYYGQCVGSPEELIKTFKTNK